MIERAGIEAKLLLRRTHACGYELANDPRPAGVSWSQKYPAHSPLHGVSADSVQRLLALAIAAGRPFIRKLYASLFGRHLQQSALCTLLV
jgi:hypothetical protein